MFYTTYYPDIRFLVTQQNKTETGLVIIRSGQPKGYFSGILTEFFFVSEERQFSIRKTITKQMLRYLHAKLTLLDKLPIVKHIFGYVF